MAGVKVARQPRESALPVVTLPLVEDSAGKVEAGFASNDGVARNTAADNDAETVEPVVPPVFVGPELPQVDPAELADLTAQIAELKLQLDRATSTVAVSSSELQQLLDKTEAAKKSRAENTERLRTITAEYDAAAERVLLLSQSLSENEQGIAAATQQLNSSEQHHRFIADRLHGVSVQTQQLQEVLDAALSVPDRSERIQHRLSPVGEPVTEHELHFRMNEGHVAYIPLEALLERLKAQVKSRSSTVMKMNRYEGSVGPVGGFRLNYTVERSSLPPLQALQYGGGSYRVSVSRWTLVPAETLDAESIDEAMLVGSRFRQVLETAPFDSTVTIWLYPDDFAQFRRIRELAHGLNLRIAARPLPAGTPIAGSPSGSRSSGQ
ncbi:MAG: hypothetical protein R3C19_19480 [Planctomycetaceae bacterium]